jgi:DNA-binding transcriptional LysR family regulator
MMPSDGLDPSSLTALHALLEERHVTRAARRLGLTQSSMSHRLQRLREALGDPLFVRTKGRLVPTPRAEAIEKPLRDALEALRAAVAPAGAFDPATSRHVFDVAMPDLLMPLLPALLAELSAAAPQVSVRVTGIPANLPAALAEGAPLLALAPSTFASASTVARPIGDVRFAVVMRRGHPLARRPLTPARWLSVGHVVVRVGNDQPNVVGKVLAERGLTRTVALEVPSFLAGLLVAAGSDLVMNAPMPLAGDVAARLGLVVREAPIPLPKIPFALLWHERYRSDPAHRWMREVIVGIVGRRLRKSR